MASEAPERSLSRILLKHSDTIGTEIGSQRGSLSKWLIDQTFLRCILESYTYFKTINCKKLISDLPDKLARIEKELIDSGNEDLVKYITIRRPEDLHVQSHILIARNNLQHSKLINNDANYHQKVAELMVKLDIIPYVYDYTDQNGSPLITNIEKYVV